MIASMSAEPESYDFVRDEGLATRHFSIGSERLVTKYMRFFFTFITKYIKQM